MTGVEVIEGDYIPMSVFVKRHAVVDSSRQVRTCFSYWCGFYDFPWRRACFARRNLYETSGIREIHGLRLFDVKDHLCGDDAQFSSYYRSEYEQASLKAKYIEVQGKWCIAPDIVTLIDLYQLEPDQSARVHLRDCEVNGMNARTPRSFDDLRRNLVNRLGNLRPSGDYWPI